MGSLRLMDDASLGGHSKWPATGDSGWPAGSIYTDDGSTASATAKLGVSMTATDEFADLADQFGSELQEHCYRMLGSARRQIPMPALVGH